MTQKRRYLGICKTSELHPRSLHHATIGYVWCRLYTRPGSSNWIEQGTPKAEVVGSTPTWGIAQRLTALLGELLAGFAD